ncbi:MAG: HEAT repeat domain-containing protein [Fidelibacterota bacterium]
MPNKLNKKLKEQAMLYALETLSEQDRRNFENILRTSSQLQEYLNELQSTLKLTGSSLKISFDETYLQGQRNLLRGRILQLEQEWNQNSTPGKILKSISNGARTLFTPRQPVWAVATYIVIAFLIGQFIPSGFYQKTNNQSTYSSSEIMDLIQGGGLTNVDLEPGDTGGKLEMALETKGSIDISGGFNDETIQQILYYMLLNDTNPGKRLRALKFLTKIPDLDNKKLVLISSVLTDPNSGIRLRALEQLSNFEPDKTITEACTKLLLEDENEAVRMGALAILGKAPTTEIIPVLRVVSLMDENPYIRDRASEILDEVNEQADAGKIEVKE